MLSATFSLLVYDGLIAARRTKGTSKKEKAESSPMLFTNLLLHKMGTT